jgi:K+-sensing histidine kinase KdpD
MNDSFSQQLIANIFSSVSHEFGTYLNCIMSLSNIAIEEESISKPIREMYLSPIAMNAHLLNFILCNMRDFNQILLNQFTLKIEDFSIMEEIQQLVSCLAMPLSSRNNVATI